MAGEVEAAALGCTVVCTGTGCADPSGTVEDDGVALVPVNASATAAVAADGLAMSDVATASMASGMNSGLTSVATGAADPSGTVVDDGLPEVVAVVVAAGATVASATAAGGVVSILVVTGATLVVAAAAGGMAATLVVAGATDAVAVVAGGWEVVSDLVDSGLGDVAGAVVSGSVTGFVGADFAVMASGDDGDEGFAPDCTGSGDASVAPDCTGSGDLGCSPDCTGSGD